MSKEEISSKVLAVVCQELALEPSQVTEEKTFIEDLGADSIAVVELIMALEETFDLDFPEDATSEIRTVGDVIKFIEAATVAS